MHRVPELVTYEARTADEVAGSVRASQRQLGAGHMWEVHTPYGGFAGGVPPNASPAVRRIEEAAVLRSSTGIPLQSPEGSFRGQPLTFQYALLAPDGFVLTFFGSGQAEVLLVQAPVGSGQQMSYSRMVSGPGGEAKSVPPSPETLTVGAQQVTWDPDTTGVNPNLAALRWEADGVSYSLYARALNKAEALRSVLRAPPIAVDSSPGTIQSSQSR